MPRRLASPVVAALLVAVALGLLAVVTDLAGPIGFRDPVIGIELPFDGIGGSDSDSGRGEGGDTGALEGLPADWVVTFAFLVASVLAALVVRSVLRAPVGEPADVAVYDDELLVGELREAADEGAARLAAAARGQAGDAVVACWMALEDAASACGTPRGAAQTPTEFTVDLLARYDADADAVNGLLRLYQQARFGLAPVADSAAREARAALQRIAATLTAARPAAVVASLSSGAGQ
ncbi:MAG: DUF4129 domain-containing protein [Jiangellaceae bacterium]